MVTTSYEWTTVSGPTPLGAARTDVFGPPEVAVLRNGAGYFATWAEAAGPGSEAHANILGQALSATGQPMGPLLTLATDGNTSVGLQRPDISALANGGVAVAWTDVNTPGAELHVRLVSPDGMSAGPELLIVTPGASPTLDLLPNVAGLPDGGFAASWLASDGMKEAFYSPDGSLRASDNVTGYTAVLSDLVALPDGDVAVLLRALSSGPASGLHPGGDAFQVVQPDGSQLGGPVTIDSGYYNVVDELHAVVNPTGYVAVAYSAQPPAGGSANQVFLQFLRPGSIRAPSGGGVSQSIAVDPDPTHDSSGARLAVTPDGYIVVSWSWHEIGGSASGVEYRMYQPGGLSGAVPIGPIYEAPAAMTPSLVGLQDGAIAGVWTDLSHPDTNETSIVALVRNSVGDSGNDTIAGFQLPNYFTGLGGNDSLLGGTANDTLDGGAGDDRLWGAAGNNLLLGADGNDSIDAGGDGNSVLSGGDGNDYLYARGGNDTLNGDASSDTLTGGSGADRFVFDHLPDSSNAAPDLIVDFQHGVDKIDLSGIDPTLSWAGTTPTPHAVWFTVSPTVTVLHIAAWGYVGSDATINLYGTSLGLTAADFVL